MFAGVQFEVVRIEQFETFSAVSYSYAVTVVFGSAHDVVLCFEVQYVVSCLYVYVYGAVDVGRSAVFECIFDKSNKYHRWHGRLVIICVDFEFYVRMMVQTQFLKVGVLADIFYFLSYRNCVHVCLCTHVS